MKYVPPKITDALMETYDNANTEDKRICYAALAESISLTMADAFVNLTVEQQNQILAIFSIEDPMVALDTWELAWKLFGKAHIGDVVFLLTMQEILEKATSPENIAAITEALGGPEKMQEELKKFEEENKPKKNSLEDMQLLRFFNSLNLPEC